MFTGIIETLATITEITQRGIDVRLSLELPSLPTPTIQLGESIAINGACMTVVALENKTVSFDISAESLRCTNLGSLKKGSHVNIEFAMLPQTRFGGHIVSGHVDGLAELISMQTVGECWELKFKVPGELQRYIAAKGSICVDGVSLTVNTVEKNIFSVNIIPHTFHHTIVQFYQVSQRVNLEVDIIARYLERLRN